MNENKYETFIIYDFKSKKCKPYTCNPKYLGNYFVHSNLPYETSLVFFNKNIFTRYKIEEDYEVTNNQIKYKNEWILKYYMSHDNSQVIILLKDLSLIPYNEQLYLKSLNEKRSSNMSEKMKKNCFYGEWAKSDNLDLLKKLLEKFPNCTINKKEHYIWKKNKNIKSPHDLENLNYLKTESKIEWESEVITLYSIIIDGLNIKTIQLIANKLDCLNNDFKSIKQLETCLIECYINKVKINQIINPLKKLNEYRSKIVAHNTGKPYPPDLVKDFNKLIDNCYDSFNCLSNIIKKGCFNFE